ncbi:peptide chain release factor 3 [Phragmitibacter flavus]|uniref:Peptide chain release factor 3 n=1 Tax=Phragmitibacter flavus TaxID=2576071 RepID=A0A5R8KB70_9BACT|nr:peptide chain release factor 3 [Phragmitibacter flavus]TLD69562.1 peptide chain release factor 3 [Phragmitibacter flavus]
MSSAAASPSLSPKLQSEVNRRRTFAIISHPDAGKTTLTEKFLLYGGALQLAGSVTARKSQRATASDWMELEKKRGISVSSTVLQFEYHDCVINLLDTPGHKDFSEDTYRVLTAVDAAVMVIDAGKGIESQTQKLFEVCRQRGIPIFTFINKMDRPARDPLELMDEIERVLSLHAYAVNWPLGDGKAFCGVFDRIDSLVHTYERTSHGSSRAPVAVHGAKDDSLRNMLDPDLYQRFSDEIEMLDGAGATFDLPQILDGELTPVFFGSAANNFGVDMLLDAFLKYAPPPSDHQVGEKTIHPAQPDFSGFIFKIQANLDPKHRDRLAFIRICSGKFERDMNVIHTRTGRKLRLSSSHKLFGRERETVDEAYAGDVVGIVGHGDFQIGDTLAQDPDLQYQEIPRFCPEHFAWLHSTSSAQTKRYREGLDQLLQEGVVQSFYMRDNAQRLPLLAAVGPLQFEVVQARLESEYGAETRLEITSYEAVRWLPKETTVASLSTAVMPSGITFVSDAADQPALLFPDSWALKYFTEKNPTIPLSTSPPK